MNTEHVIIKTGTTDYREELENFSWKQRNARDRYAEYVRGADRKTRVYLFAGDRETHQVFDALPTRQMQKLRRQVLREALEAEGLDPNTKARWSRTAGCSCGCSPGFILEGDTGKDIFADFIACFAKEG